MDDRPAQPPEGRLIADALRRTRLSIREASRRAGISYGRWRQITTGYQNVSPGEYARVRAPADTLARMAAVVGVTADELAEAGRPDAAEALASLPAQPPGDSYGHSVDGLTADEARILRAYVDGLRRGRAVGGDDPTPPETNGQTALPVSGAVASLAVPGRLPARQGR